MFTFAKVEVIWFDTLASDQSLALLHVLHINYVSDKTSGLRLKFETLISAKDKLTHCVSPQNNTDVGHRGFDNRHPILTVLVETLLKVVER